MHRIQHEAVDAFRSLHEPGPLVLPNAWDPASAVLIEAAGASAIATTSAGIAWANGRPDGEQIGRERMLEALAEIVASVAIPVSADIESGYGPTPEAAASIVSALIEMGVAGINIEDSPGIEAPLREPSIQAARIAAARSAADGAQVPIWINARTDVFLIGAGTPREQLLEAMRRADVYAQAGADSLFVPGAVDLKMIAALADGSLPINVMVDHGAPDVASLAAAGARRISAGASIAQAAYGIAAQAAAEMLTAGTYESFRSTLSHTVLNGMFNR